jgi:hypothetical protein
MLGLFFEIRFLFPELSTKDTDAEASFFRFAGVLDTPVGA